VLGAGDPLMAKYPEVDAIIDREMIELSIDADVAGATCGSITAASASRRSRSRSRGDHVLAVRGPGLAARRRVGDRGPHAAVDQDPDDRAGDEVERAREADRELARVPPPEDIGRCRRGARAHRLIRHGDVIEAWAASATRRRRTSSATRRDAERRDATKVMGLVLDRVHAWNDHAPDPHQPLLVESPAERLRRKGGGEGRADESGGSVTRRCSVRSPPVRLDLRDDRSSDTQHIEVHVP